MCNPLLRVYSGLPCTGEPRQAQPRSTPWLQTRAGMERRSYIRVHHQPPPTAAFTAPPATHSHTDQLYTWLKPPLNYIVVAGFCAGAAVRLPGQVQQPGGPPRHLRPRPLLAGGRQQGKQVSTVNIFGLT